MLALTLNDPYECWQGAGSIVCIAVILIFIFYGYAIVGMMLFKQNDPFHFATVPVAMITMFRAGHALFNCINSAAIMACYVMRFLSCLK